MDPNVAVIIRVLERMRDGYADTQMALFLNCAIHVFRTREFPADPDRLFEDIRQIYFGRTLLETCARGDKALPRYYKPPGSDIVTDLASMAGAPPWHRMVMAAWLRRQDKGSPDFDIGRAVLIGSRFRGILVQYL